MDWKMTLLVERRKGLEEGISRGEFLKAIRLIMKKRSLGMSAEQIVEDIFEPRELVERVFSKISSFPNAEAEEILHGLEEEDEDSVLSGEIDT